MTPHAATPARDGCSPTRPLDPPMNARLSGLDACANEPLHALARHFLPQTRHARSVDDLLRSAVGELERLTGVFQRLPQSSPEEGDVARGHAPGVDACVVALVEFKAFVAALAELGISWVALNEPPPGSAKAVRRVARPA